MIFEKGRGSSSLTTKAKATGTQHTISNFEIQRGNGERRMDLTSQPVIEARVVGGTGGQAIKAGAIFRVYLAPITQWAMGFATCSAECKSYPLNGKQCGGPDLQCETEEVVTGSGRKNIVKVHMPANMPDEITNVVTHSIVISSLDLPKTGFFNKRLGVQLTRKTDDQPVYITSNGYIYKKDAPGMTTGRLLVNGQTGYGPRPFKGEQQNLVFLRLQFGSSLWHNGDNDAASFTIKLPAQTNREYQCTVPTTVEPLTGTANGIVPHVLPDGTTMAVFNTDADNDGYNDNNHGTLKVGSTEEGSWDGGSSECLYKFKKDQSIHAGQVIYIFLTGELIVIVAALFRR